MIQIVICETDQKKMQELRKHLVQVSIESNIEFEVFWLCSSQMQEKLAEHIASANIALVSMELERGAELAKAIRRLNRQCCLFIYGGEARALPHWIPGGPVAFCPSMKEVPEELHRLVQEIGEDSYIFQYQSRRETGYVPYSGILYFQSDKRTVSLVCRKGEVRSFSGKLDQVEAELPAGYFLRIHQSYLVNRRAVSRLDRAARELEMENGQRLPISARYYGEVALLLSRS